VAVDLKVNGLAAGAEENTPLQRKGKSARSTHHPQIDLPTALCSLAWAIVFGVSLPDQ
jgi:hypothetical protein